MDVDLLCCQGTRPRLVHMELEYDTRYFVVSEENEGNKERL
jgi:hypothetical protein